MMRSAFALFFACAGALHGQARDTLRSQDPALQRARQMMTEGQVTEGRRVIDSLLRITSPGSALYADALYWRAALAPTAAEAEHDYSRLLIEAPLSKRAEDALLQLAQLEQARGDRRGATEHLQRFLLSYSKHPARPRVALTVVRLLFEQGPQQLAPACEALRAAREEIRSESLELRNQLEYYAPRCAMAESTAPPSAVASADSSPAGDRVRPPAASPRPTTLPPSSAPPASRTPFYSVQVAAYDSREPASRLADLLQSRDIEARVDGTARPFRVRVGRYVTRAEAARAAAALKAQGHNGFITLVSPR